jgi:hypothetical protein
MAIERPIWIYWLVCGLAISLLAINRKQIPLLLSPTMGSPQSRQGYALMLTVGWVASLVAAIAYVLLTRKQVAGFYSLPDLVAFSLLNGVLEQLMFVFWFLLGCWVGSQLGIQVSWKIFGLGFLSNVIYSGAIHALFWVKVLPAHQPALVMPVLLLIMSLAWMWLFWRYRAVVAIIAMHMAIDFLTIGHLHFTWFEPYQ